MCVRALAGMHTHTHTYKMQPSLKGASSHTGVRSEKENVSNVRDRSTGLEVELGTQADSRKPKWVLPASCISRKEIPQLPCTLKTHKPSLTPQSCCHPAPLKPATQTSNVIFLMRLEGKICLSIWKSKSPDLIVVLSPIPSVDGYYSTEIQAVTVPLSFFLLFPILRIHTNNSSKKGFQHLSPCPH